MPREVHDLDGFESQCTTVVGQWCCCWTVVVHFRGASSVLDPGPGRQNEDGFFFPIVRLLILHMTTK